MAAAEKRIAAELRTARARGELTPFTGSKERDRRRCAETPLRYLNSGRIPKETD
jgi:hypothetical protein